MTRLDRDMTVELDDHIVDGHLRSNVWYLSCTCGWDSSAEDGDEDDEVDEHLGIVEAS